MLSHNVSTPLTSGEERCVTTKKKGFSRNSRTFSDCRAFSFLRPFSRGGGGGVLPYKRLMGMCRRMGSHFHDWIDYNGVAFSIELLEWGRTFSDFLG